MARVVQLIDDVVVHKFEVGDDEFTIGRHPESDVVVDDAAASSLHAKIVVQSNEFFPQYDEFFLEDVQSTNGTYINGVRLVGRQRLRNNDVIRVAYNRFKFIDDMEEDLEKTVLMLEQCHFTSEPE